MSGDRGKDFLMLFLFALVLLLSTICLALSGFLPAGEKLIKENLIEKKAKSFPFIPLIATVTSKDGNQLAVSSELLPRKGDLIAVDKYAYGSVVVGDSVCIQYKSLPEEPQYGAEFVSEGPCK